VLGMPEILLQGLISVNFFLSEPVTSAKYLGVTLQSNLKWNTHIDNITSNGNKSLGYLKRNLQISNPKVKYSHV
jgi:hypothetical protein